MVAGFSRAPWATRTPIGESAVGAGSAASRSCRYWLNRYRPHALSAAMPISMPIMRATTTDADAMPCWAAGTTRRVADVSGPITRPRPRPAIARSVSSIGSVMKPRSWRAASRSSRPSRDQPVAARGDQQADEGDDPIADAGGDPAAKQGADRQRDQEPQQQEGGLVLVLPQHALAEQFDVDQRHHQRRAGGQRGAQRREERPEVHTGGLDQPGAGEPLPDEERHGGDHRADEQRQAVARQHLFAVRCRVVQPPRRQAQRDRQQQTADDVDLLRGLGLLP